jgi:hypothetical protein
MDKIDFAPDQSAAINAACQWFHWRSHERKPFLLYGPPALASRLSPGGSVTCSPRWTPCSSP